MMPPAPPRLSITRLTPSAFCMYSAAMRATASVLPPGANGTTRRMLRLGHLSCADAASGANTTDRMARTVSSFCMSSPDTKTVIVADRARFATPDGYAKQNAGQPREQLMSNADVLDTRFRASLERMAEQGRLQAYVAPVNPHLEVAGIMKRLDGGPALLFTEVDGYDVPVVGELLTCQDNCEAAFGIDFRGIR